MFDSISRWMENEIYIDLGTANTLVMDRDLGLVANEPSVIAFQELSNGDRRIVAVGREAKKKIGRTPGNLRASHPLKNGVIAELDATQAMLSYFLSFAPRRIVKPRMVISLPYGVSDIEKSAVRDCGLSAGAREVVLIEEPMAAAIGSGLPVKESRGSMVIDIGGGTTEVAIISLCGIVHCEAIRIGGHRFDEAIVEYLRRRYNLVIGDQSAEKLKISIGTALPIEPVKSDSIRGIDFSTGLPREVILTSSDVLEAIDPLLREIIQAARKAFEQTPPELLGDLIENGIVLVGGGALINNIDRRLENELCIPVRRSADPLLAVAKGGVSSLRDPELLEKISL